ncbi:hypothetical protein [Aliikangiella maris]|uniref:Uncharacterized protein n=2 Tax=Aliikangiella maris TaxID=3162458 RepID=A0ABV3MR86_9GAMM
MREIVSIFGRNNNLQGILSLNDQSGKPPIENDTMLVVLNAGTAHKAGPFRLNVDIARYAAKNNINAFRFDLGGLGDSIKVPSALTHEESVLNDIEDALDFLEYKYQAKNFIVIGLCTGAVHSHKMALKDERVIGCIWLDGYGYPTNKFHFLRYAQVAVDPVRLASSVSKRTIGKLFGSKDKAKMLNGESVDEYIWKLPPIEQYIDEMNFLKQRDVKCLYIFTGGINEYYNYEAQFTDVFGDYDFMKNVDIKYIESANHTFVVRRDKQVMLNVIGDWLKKILKVESNTGTANTD